jgi:transposase InsO family protein
MNLYLLFLLFTFAGWVNRHQQAVIEYLQAENQALREQLGKQRIRWTDAQRCRLAARAKAVGRAALHQLGTVVTPDTLLPWYRNLVAAKYDGSKRHGPGRPPTKPDIVGLIVRMAKENPSWGNTRMRGALYNLSHEVARNTIKNILFAHGLEPAPERGRHTTWHTFLKSHLGAIAGADFLTVEVLRSFGPVRYYVFFVMDIATRRVHIAGITSQPCEAWMKQIARNLTDCVDGFLKRTKYLILDRDPLYTHVFRGMLKDAGVKVVRLPARSPDLNSYAERWVRSAKSECLSRVIPLGEQHLRNVISEYLAHYHGERNHQGLGNRLLEPLVANTNSGKDVIRRRERLGGVLNYYYLEVA